MMTVTCFLAPRWALTHIKGVARTGAPSLCRGFFIQSRSWEASDSYAKRDTEVWRGCHCPVGATRVGRALHELGGQTRVGLSPTAHRGLPVTHSCVPSPASLRPGLGPAARFPRLRSPRVRLTHRAASAPPTAGARNVPGAARRDGATWWPLRSLRPQRRKGRGRGGSLRYAEQGARIFCFIDAIF